MATGRNYQQEAICLRGKKRVHLSDSKIVLTEPNYLKFGWTNGESLMPNRLELGATSFGKLLTLLATVK